MAKDAVGEKQHCRGYRKWDKAAGKSLERPGKWQHWQEKATSGGNGHKRQMERRGKWTDEARVV